MTRVERPGSCSTPFATVLFSGDLYCAGSIRGCVPEAPLNQASNPRSSLAALLLVGCVRGSHWLAASEAPRGVGQLPDARNLDSGSLIAVGGGRRAGITGLLRAHAAVATKTSCASTTWAALLPVFFLSFPSTFKPGAPLFLEQQVRVFVREPASSFQKAGRLFA